MMCAQVCRWLNSSAMHKIESDHIARQKEDTHIALFVRVLS